MPPKTTSESFWFRVNKTGDCWLWTGAKDLRGYGLIGYDGLLWRTHRLAWFLTYGAIPDDLCVCHTCDVRLCCNPIHLWLGTKAQNSQDMVRKGRNGALTIRHAKGERVNTAKLTAEQVLDIRTRFDARLVTCAQLAREYHVSHPAIRQIVKRLHWKHLP